MWEEFVSNPDRDKIFLTKFLKDADTLSECGFSEKQVEKMLMGLDYVRIYANIPRWLWYAKKLPKGNKWSDGIKVKENGSCRNTYYILEVEKDLYIKGYVMVGTSYRDSKIVRISDYRNLPGKDVGEYFQGTLGDALMQLWKEKGLSQGFTYKILKDVEGHSNG